MSARRVAITGCGALCGYGQGLDALWQGVKSGRSAIRPHRARLGNRAWTGYAMAALDVSIDEIARGLPNPALVRSERLARDPDLIAIADCVRQALADAGLRPSPDGNDVGLVVTHESPGLSDHLQSFFRWRETFAAWLRSPVRFNAPEFLYQLKSDGVYRLHAFLYVHYLSAVFGLHGFCLYNNNACASGAFALAVAADRVRSGEASAMVVAGGDVPEDGTKCRWFRDLGLYSTRGVCSPFETGRDGLVLGSGAAAFVLEDLDTARAAGKRIYAEWLGAGFTSEGWKVTLPDVTSGRYTEAVALALRHAGVTPQEIDLLVPHGVGSGLLDRHEAESLAAIFGRGGDGWPPLLAAKAAVGHTLGGSALLETAMALVVLQHAELPELVSCPRRDPQLPLGPPSGGHLASPWTLLKCTNGFAGQNGAIVLRSV